MNGMDEMGMTGQHITVPLCDRTVSSEVSGEYTLPDYQPEIRRLLWVKQTVLPPAKYIGGGQVELNGTVDYQILYVGGDGAVYSAPLSSEYSISVPLEPMAEADLGAGVTAFATTVCESVSTRVSAPRKINIRSRLRSHVHAFGSILMEERISGAADSSTVRRLGGEAENVYVTSGVSDMITASTEFGGIGEDTRVITADASVLMNEVSAQDGMVSGCGELLLKLMLCDENGREECVTKKLSVEGQIEMDGMTGDGMCNMRGIVSEMSVTVEDGRILCEMGVILEARGLRNRVVHYTSDLYSTAVESDCEYRSYSVPVALRCENGNVSQSERIPLEGLNLPQGAFVLDAIGSVVWDGCELMGEKYVLSGQSRYQLLCRREEEYSVAELTLPVRLEVQGSGMTPTGYDAVGEVLSCRARIDGDTLNLDAELSVVADFMGTEEIRAVSEIRFGEQLDCQGNRMVVYYPTSEDTAWTVAKRYHISPEKLSEGSFYYVI